MVFEDDPAGQSEQVVAPVESVNVPTKHSSQMPPATLFEDPMGQAVHDNEPSVEDDPAGHGVHADVSGAGYCPAGQASKVRTRKVKKKNRLMKLSSK